MDQVAFVINPVSGSGRNLSLLKILEKELSAYGSNTSIFRWNEVGDLESILASILKENIKKVVAIGGDGTVNAIGSRLCGSDISLGIIPRGSGNGLARHLKIPMDIRRALNIVFSGDSMEIDVCAVNGKKFFCTAGTGFDALISAAFSIRKTRGKYSYAQLILAKSLAYKGKPYRINFNEETIERTAFLITVANANQFGNDFLIAPQAVINDGMMELCILNSFNKFKLPEVTMRLMNGKIGNDDAYESYRVNKLSIELPEPDWLHLDGEPEMTEGKLEFEVLPEKLKIIVPEK